MNLQREIPLPKWLGIRYQFQLRAVLITLFRITCWSGVSWLVWNHALSGFLNAGSVGPLLSVGLGAFLHTMSAILED